MPATFVRAFAALFLAVAALSACSTADTLSYPTPALTPQTSEKYASIVVDAGTGRTLYQVEADAPRYPASLTKMMTLYMLFEALDQGRISKDTQLVFSARAARQPPTKLGVRAGGSVDVDTAIRALAVKSANDVAVAVAEHLGGSEEQFAAMMTARARGLGMTRTTFRNASGLPDAAQQTTARDMATLGAALRRRFPHHYGYFSLTGFSYAGRSIRGHNDLVGGVAGVDGIKTGYIRASGYNVATSVSRGGRRLVVVVMGGETARGRNAHVEELIERFLPGSASPRAVGRPVPAL